ncbi:MAG: trigger factor [Planctomycetaceae bacterium]|nr:trigger factor [Planctomycetaceae bacterium]
MSSETEEAVGSETETEQVAGGLSLSVDIKPVGPCKKHVSVTVSETDIVSIRNEVLGELGDKAQVPGFRVGKAPRALLQKRFRDEIATEIKQKVLLASLEQLSEEYKIEPLGQPNLDVDSLAVPEEGDFHYEFDVEVRPDFELPDYTGVELERPSGELTDEEISAFREEYLGSFGQRKIKEGAAAAGDYVVCSFECSHNGAVIREVDDVSVRVVATLNFQDARLDGFDTLMVGANVGDTREASVQISVQSPIVEMRGEQVALKISVHEIQSVEPPVLDKEFLGQLNCETPEELDDAIRQSMTRQIEYQGRQTARRQILEKITESADWDLPESLVRQQTENALRREILEMAQAGFTREQIAARESQIRQDAIETTRQALKEHFVLDRIATQENIEAEEMDVAMELQMMSFQSGESVRRIRARMAKSGRIENLLAQLRERKTVDFMLSKAQFKDVEREPLVRADATSLRVAICGNMESSLIDDSVDGDDEE